MKILHRYIVKIIILASIAVIATVIGFSFFLSLLGELRDIGTGDYGFQQALFHSFLKIPHDVYQFFPMLTLLGGVIGLGMLAANHELMVMRTSGLSVQKVIAATFSAALFLILLATLLGEGIAPRAIYLADKYKQIAENGGQAVATTSGIWIHEGNNFLHIDRVIGHRHLEGVRRFDFDTHHHLLSAYYAKTMDFQNGHWQIHDMSKTLFSHDRTFSQFLKNGTWDLMLNPNLLNVGMTEPEELSLPNLANYSQHLAENGLQATSFQFEFWKRIFQPLMTLVMIFLAIPFVFGSPRSMGMGWRIVLSVLVGFTFYMLNACLGQISIVYQISPCVAALLPTIVFAIVGYILTLKIA